MVAVDGRDVEGWIMVGFRLHEVGFTWRLLMEVAKSTRIHKWTWNGGTCLIKALNGV